MYSSIASPTVIGPYLPWARCVRSTMAFLAASCACQKSSTAVGVGVVVGGADALDLVVLLADVMPGDPGAGLAVTKSAVAEVEAALDRAVVRLPPDLEAAACFSGIQIAIVNPASHAIPLLDTLIG